MYICVVSNAYKIWNKINICNKKKLSSTFMNLNIISKIHSYRFAILRVIREHLFAERDK